jgi:hypothetical protein
MTASFRNVGEPTDYATRVRNERDKARNELEAARRRIGELEAIEQRALAELEDCRSLDERSLVLRILGGAR